MIAPDTDITHLVQSVADASVAYLETEEAMHRVREAIPNHQPPPIVAEWFAQSRQATQLHIDAQRAWREAAIALREARGAT
jgi:hypothetical protein